ncbi:hypothetical protein ACFY1S_06085 [Micromonospora sp. NPDC000663]|uniref:hypothetical protein n=1 Tax=Micromonospora sp. NPDC000663 TaxID=3364218 RepID=UPI00369840E6
MFLFGSWPGLDGDRATRQPGDPATVVVTFVAPAQDDPIVWVSYVPLLPLALLLFTGLYLFALPYLAERRRAGRPG